MKREITTYEVRSFFAAANKQFEEASFYLNDVHFNRDEEGCLQGIKLNYTEKTHRMTNMYQQQVKNPQGIAKRAVSRKCFNSKVFKQRTYKKRIRSNPYRRCRMKRK